MKPTAQQPPTFATLARRLTNVLVSPGEVFDEVLAQPVTLANWRIPTLLACSSAIILTQFSVSVEARQLPAGLSSLQSQQVALGWPLVSAMAACAAVLGGSITAALVLWGSGRIFLRSKFSFLKTLELVGLSQALLVLGSVVTALLIGATGDPSARPALSLLALKSAPGTSVRPVLDMLNVFHLWSAGVLAIGLSKLARVTFAEAAFWIFGYWIFLRLALILLS